MFRASLAALLVAACACASTTSVPTGSPAPSPDRATVPLHLDGNRPYVDLSLQTVNGEARAARFLVDTGGGGFLLTEPLARDLGLRLGERVEDGGQSFAVVTSPLEASVGTVALALRTDRVLVAVGRTSILQHAPGHADGLLPGHVLARYDVVFDYPKRLFTLGKPGTIAPEGAPMPMPVQPESGFPRTELEVDGQPYGMLLDTGASFTIVSEVLLKAWGTAHADWRRYPGAYGEAATLGGSTLETMFIPRATWRTFELANIGVVSQREGTFERWMSSMTAEPIVGALAGNVLRQFRIQLDYANETLYVSQP